MPKRVDPALCAQCKGVRRLCGFLKCPILVRLEEELKIQPIVRKTSLYAATPPSILVTERNYPYVTLGPNVAPETGREAKKYDDPESWWGSLTLEEVIRLRARTVFSSFRAQVTEARKPSGKLLELIRELALSAEPVDAEYVFKKPPQPRVSFDGIVAPLGPVAPLQRLRIASNPVVPRRVDQLIYDEDAKASTSVLELYSSGVSVYHIVRLFSLGLLGTMRERRIVPTRWSITAVDSILGDRLLKTVKTFKEISEYRIYKTEYMGNRYFIIMVPAPWSFEMIEIWLPRSVWIKSDKPFFTVNYELYDGKWRKPGVDGGYHAIRFPVIEFLYREKRQATVVAIREVTKDYYAPVGSWQIRESVRNALEGKPIIVNNISEALSLASKFIETDINMILAKSFILKILMKQKKITEYV
ncbi:MAG: hypothetical protein DRJ63_08265 [Thermoprotei archaeon]|nr:MAG: hypothetical protein DRJ63_08265 [Thermoprotei archaeon]